MSDYPQSIDNFGGNSSWSPSPMGRMPAGIGSLLMMAFGNKIWPLLQPGTPQSQFDAMWQRNHDLQMMQVARNAVANWYPIQNLGGMNPKSMTGQIATALMSQPDGIFAKLMSPVLGGNPIQAQMASFANLQGINTAGLGTLGGTSIGQLDSYRKAFEAEFYNQKVKPINANSPRALGYRDKALENLRSYGIGADASMFNKDFTLNQGNAAAATFGSASGIINDIRNGNYTKATDAEAALDKLGLGKNLSKDIKDAIETGFKEGGKDWPKKFAEEINKKPIGVAADQMQGIAGLQAWQKMAAGVNYEHTLGFNYEDLTGARDSLLKSRMAGGMDLKGLSKIFGGGSGAYVPAVLDAARSTFGNDLTGKQLADKISGFVGYSNINIADRRDADKLETTLRRMKSVARTSNIDFDAIMGFEAEAQDYSSQFGSTGRLGGIELGNLVSDQILKTAAVSTGMDSQSVRWQGGTAGMARSRIAGAVESASSPIASQLAALHTYFSGDAGIQQRIKEYAAKGNLTAIGYNGFLKSLPGNANELLNYAVNNETAMQQGFSNAPELMKAGGRSQVDSMFQRLFYQWGGGAQGAGVVQRAQSLLKTGNINAFLTDKQVGVGEFANMWKSMANKGFLDDWMIGNNPTMAKNFQIQQQAVSEGVALDKNIARTMGKMNVPIMQRLVQAIASGDMGTQGLSSILAPLGIDDRSPEFQGLTNTIDMVNKIDLSKSVEDVALNAGVGTSESAALGGKGGISEVAAKYGLTADAMAKIAQGGLTTDEIKKLSSDPSSIKGHDQALEIIKSSKSLESIKNNARLSGYSGPLDQDSLAAFYKNKAIDDTIDNFSGNKDIEARFDQVLTGDMAGISKMTGDANAMSLSRGLANLGGADDIFKTLEGVQGQKAMGGGYEEEKDSTGKGTGKYKITGAYETMARAFAGDKDKTFEFGSEKEAQDRIAKMNEVMQSNPALQGLVAKHMEHKAEIDKMKKDAHEKQDTPDLLKKILDMLKELPKLSAAVTTLGTNLGLGK